MDLSLVFLRLDLFMKVEEMLWLSRCLGQDGKYPARKLVCLPGPLYLKNIKIKLKNRRKIIGYIHIFQDAQKIKKKYMSLKQMKEPSRSDKKLLSLNQIFLTYLVKLRVV